MITTATRQAFGEMLPARRMSPMARGILARICGGREMSFAGFVWYRPHALLPEDLVRTEVRSAAQHAA